MISYIKGSLEYIGEGFIIVENGGIGYKIGVTASTQAGLSKIRSEIKVFTYMNVKEDELSLFGFLSMEELNMFSLLITVSGVGPKGALAMLDAMNPQKIALAIITGDIKALSSGQGIGKKIAQRIALELKDKVKSEDALDLPHIETESGAGEAAQAGEAAEALIALGFGRSEAVKAVSAVYKEGMDSGSAIRLALKELNKK